MLVPSSRTTSSMQFLDCVVLENETDMLVWNIGCQRPTCSTQCTRRATSSVAKSSLFSPCMWVREFQPLSAHWAVECWVPAYLSSACNNKLSKTRISRREDNVAEGNKDLSERSHISTHYPCTAAVVSVYNQYTYSNSGTCHEMNPVRRTRSWRIASPVFILHIIKYGSISSFWGCVTTPLELQSIWDGYYESWFNTSLEWGSSGMFDSLHSPGLSQESQEGLQLIVSFIWPVMQVGVSGSQRHSNAAAVKCSVLSVIYESV